jgi:hypothetical protein
MTLLNNSPIIVQELLSLMLLDKMNPIYKGLHLKNVQPFLLLLPYREKGFHLPGQKVPAVQGL